MSGDLQAAMARAQAAQARRLGYRDAATRYDPSNGKDETMTPPIKRYILSVQELASVQYDVEAESEEEARASFERGEVTTHLVDEHFESEIVDIKEIGPPLEVVEYAMAGGATMDEVMDLDLANAKNRPDITHPSEDGIDYDLLRKQRDWLLTLPRCDEADGLILWFDDMLDLHEMAS